MNHTRRTSLKYQSLEIWALGRRWGETAFSHDCLQKRQELGGILTCWLGLTRTRNHNSGSHFLSLIETDICLKIIHCLRAWETSKQFYYRQTPSPGERLCERIHNLSLSFSCLWCPAVESQKGKEVGEPREGKEGRMDVLWEVFL